MFSGGVFIVDYTLTDKFFCSDNVTMTTKKLKEICFSIVPNIKSKEQFKKDLFYVDATTTLVINHQKYLFGISTYQRSSSALLYSIFARIIATLKHGEFKLSEKSRALFIAINWMLSYRFEELPVDENALDNIKDISIKLPSAPIINPSINGSITSEFLPINEHSAYNSTFSGGFDSIILDTIPD